jgi:hypothetical protein
MSEQGRGDWCDGELWCYRAADAMDFDQQYQVVPCSTDKRATGGGPCACDAEVPHRKGAH